MEKKKTPFGTKVFLEIVGILVFGFFCLVLTITTGSYAFGGKTVNYNSYVADGGHPSNNDYVEITIPVDQITPTYYISLKKTYYFIPVGSSYYYLAQLEDGSLISIIAKDSLDDYRVGDNYVFKGQYHETMNTKVKAKLKDELGTQFYEMGELNIDAKDTPMKNMLLILGCGLGAILCLIALIVTIKHKPQATKADAASAQFIQQSMANAAPQNPVAPQDFTPQNPSGGMPQDPNQQ